MQEMIVIGIDDAGNLAIRTCVDLPKTIGLMEQAKFALLSHKAQEPIKKIVAPPALGR